MRLVDLVETPQGKKPLRRLDVSEASALFSNSSSTASKIADKENQLMHANIGPCRTQFRDQTFERETSDPFKPFKDADEENIRPLFTKIVDQHETGLSDQDAHAYLERNPFDDNDYLRRVTELHRANGHSSLIPRALQDQHMSDFEYNSNDDQMEEYPFCKGENFILSQQPSQLNFQPAPRHSMPERFMPLSQLESVVESKEFQFINEMDYLDNGVQDQYNNGQQSSTTNSSTKMLTARNELDRQANLSTIASYVPLRGPKRRECFV